MEIGIVGLPNVGKSTLFNALTSGHAASSNYPFTTIEPNIGIVFVTDPRLKRLSEIRNPLKVTPATVKFVDIAGLVKGASTGEGLGNQFLSHIREVDAIVQVVRLFSDSQVVHPMGEVDPLRDIEVVETELILADIQSIEKQIEKLSGGARSGEKESKKKIETLKKILKSLSAGVGARQCGLSSEEMKPFFLLTAKPVLYLGNEDEEHIGQETEMIKQLKALSQKRHSRCLTISGKVESELAQIVDEAEKASLRVELGMKETGLEILIRESYGLLDLITFFTAVGSKEVRGWTLPRGSSAVQAAGRVHSDMAKGFIKAEVYQFSDLDRWGSEKALQEKGILRTEGRDYRVEDGDVCHFLFR